MARRKHTTVRSGRSRHSSSGAGAALAAGFAHLIVVVVAALASGLLWLAGTTGRTWMSHWHSGGTRKRRWMLGGTSGIAVLLVGCCGIGSLAQQPATSRPAQAESLRVAVAQDQQATPTALASPTAALPTTTATAIPPTETSTALSPTETATAIPPTITATAIPPTSTATAKPVRPTAVVRPTRAPQRVAPAAPAAPSGARTGAICRDGSRSFATGRGACSHHGGVAQWLYR